MTLSFEEILSWLRLPDPEELQTLWSRADQVRREQVGDEVFLRGLIEISNICRRDCLYCGIRIGNTLPRRYRLSNDEILQCVRLAEKLGYGTVVIQSGEDSGIRSDQVTNAIRRIRKETNLAITLSLGERSDEDYQAWFEAGANRYLLRFETSNPDLFRAIHPPLPGREPRDRIAILKRLRAIGYEIGSGVMVGIPGQSWNDLARDIELFGSLDLDMIGCGPFLPHPSTPLGQIFGIDSDTGLFLPGKLTEKQKDFCQTAGIPILEPEEQVSCLPDGRIEWETTPFRVIALTRLVCPTANIPSTTAIATIDPKRGRLWGLSCGANIIMPNLTPTRYRRLYEIYPNKAASYESPEQTHDTAIRQITETGRKVGAGAGISPRFANRGTANSKKH